MAYLPTPPTSSLAERFLKDGEAALGMDFGNSNSKMSLAFSTALRGSVEVQRVMFHGAQDDPERPKHPTEFVAMAALEGGRLICGQQALYRDITIPLKSMLTYVAGIQRRRVVERLPGGRVLLRAVQQSLIDVDAMRNALRRHFELLRGAALQQAEISRVRIRALVLTYPNYLHAGEKDTDFDLYMSEYIALLRPIWGPGIVFESVSEGQGAGLYICEQFEDPFSAADRRKRHGQIFHGLDAKGLNLVVVDIGTSTINLQGLSVYFDEDGEVAASTSNVPHGWKGGAQGGSGLSNDSVRAVVESYLAPLERQGRLLEGELAAILLDFEERKRRLNYVTQKDSVILRGTDAYRTFPLSAMDIREAFRIAFQDGLQLFKGELRRVLDLGKDFTVLFCGGSFCNPGLYTEVREMMSEFEDLAAAKGITAKSTFLRDEYYWSSAVSSGAALSLMRLPEPTNVMVGSAIGLQTVVLTQRGWEGSSEAGFLFGRDPRGSEARAPCNLYIHHKRTNKIKLFLVCDPMYYKTPADTIRPIQIGAPREVIGGPLTTYDLAWTISPKDVPTGKLRVRASCPSFEQARQGAYEALRLHVSCCKLNRSDVEARHHKDKKWCLTLKTDPATKLLQVVEQREWPMWCSRCACELVDAARFCANCKYHTCLDCWLAVSEDQSSMTGNDSKHVHDFEHLSMSP